MRGLMGEEGSAYDVSAEDNICINFGEHPRATIVHLPVCWARQGIKPVEETEAHSLVG